MDTAARDLLAAQWRDVAAALGVAYQAHPAIDLPSGGRHQFSFLLPQFGSPRGILVATEHHPEAFRAARAAGFAVSTMGPETRLAIDPADYVECLRDWGWAATELAPPPWYAEAANNAV